jgi:hypothetical protein
MRNPRPQLGENKKYAKQTESYLDQQLGVQFRPFEKRSKIAPRAADPTFLHPCKK